METGFLPGNRVTLLESGGEYFPALLEAIEAARDEIHLETYIFADDPAGRAVASALARAARRGVPVRLLVDGFGAREFPSGLGAPLVRDGVELMVYRPEAARLRLRRHRLRRLHRKLAVIDGRVAFVGGINVLDDLTDPGVAPDQAAPRYDYAVRIEGPLLGPIHAAVRHLWQLVRWADLRRRYPMPPPRSTEVAPKGAVSAAFVIRDNLRHRRDIEDAYLEAIDGAREEVVIASAYFLPGRRFRHALREAAGRGVRIVILLQGRVEYRLQHHATQALYASLLASGMRIFEYHKSFLHAKVAVVDGAWATVGSSNIDPFSLLLAREANVVMRDGGFAQVLRASLGRAMDAGAREVRCEDLKQRSWSLRALNWLAYALVRLLVGFTRYGGKDYRE